MTARETIMKLKTIGKLVAHHCAGRIVLSPASEGAGEHRVSKVLALISAEKATDTVAMLRLDLSTSEARELAARLVRAADEAEVL